MTDQPMPPFSHQCGHFYVGKTAEIGIKIVNISIDKEIQLG